MKIRSGPSGLHLFDRRSGLNLLIEEVQPPQSTWSLAPRTMSIALTNACELRCSHCYAPKTPATADFGQVLDLSKELDDLGCLGVAFGGGEPTNFPHFASLCKTIAKETSLAISFTTHGHRISHELVERLSGYVHFVRVSMDGVGTTYERVRGRPFGDFVQKLSLIKSLAPFGINYVINRETLADLNEAVGIALSYGAQEVLLLPQQATLNSPGVDAATMKALDEWISSGHSSCRLAVSEFGVESLSSVTLARPFEAEPALASYAHIDASGTLKRTSYDSIGISIGGRGIADALKRLQSLGGGT